MTYNELEEEIKRIILLINPRIKYEQLIPTVKIDEELGIDSLDYMDILTELEKTVGMELVGNEADNELQQKFFATRKGTLKDLIDFFYETIKEKE